MIHQNPIDQEVAFTSAWWSRTLKDEPKLIAWLQKLEQTEIGGYDDYMAFIAAFDPDERTHKIFTNIAEDEKKHAGIITDVLSARGFELNPVRVPSTYWMTMNSHIVDLQTAAAVNYFGEALAAFRFEVLIEHHDTPQDIKEMLSIILPDEQFHRETLKRLSGDKLDEFVDHHHRAVSVLKGSK